MANKQYPDTFTYQNKIFSNLRRQNRSTNPIEKQTKIRYYKSCSFRTQSEKKANQYIREKCTAFAVKKQSHQTAVKLFLSIAETAECAFHVAKKGDSMAKLSTVKIKKSKTGEKRYYEKKSGRRLSKKEFERRKKISASKNPPATKKNPPTRKTKKTSQKIKSSAFSGHTVKGRNYDCKKSVWSRLFYKLLQDSDDYDEEKGFVQVFFEKIAARYFKNLDEKYYFWHVEIIYPDLELKSINSGSTALESGSIEDTASQDLIEIFLKVKDAAGRYKAPDFLISAITLNIREEKEGKETDE